MTPLAQLQAALAELADAARADHAAGHAPLTILSRLFTLQERLRAEGVELPPTAALQAVRRLVGLASWNPLDAWAADVAAADVADLVAGLESPPVVEHERRRRALSLADWLQRRAETALAARITDAAEDLARGEIGDAA